MSSAGKSLDCTNKVSQLLARAKKLLTKICNKTDSKTSHAKISEMTMALKNSKRIICQI